MLDNIHWTVYTDFRSTCTRWRIHFPARCFHGSWALSLLRCPGSLQVKHGPAGLAFGTICTWLCRGNIWRLARKGGVVDCELCNNSAAEVEPSGYLERGLVPPALHFLAFLSAAHSIFSSLFSSSESLASSSAVYSYTMPQPYFDLSTIWWVFGALQQASYLLQLLSGLLWR